LNETYRLPLTILPRQTLYQVEATWTEIDIEEETGFDLENNHYVNLTEALRQQILVNVPIRAACGEVRAGYETRSIAATLLLPCLV
jgi:uncharacterized metal-binding protein YceD (DUF177 family)